VASAPPRIAKIPGRLRKLYKISFLVIFSVATGTKIESSETRARQGDGSCVFYKLSNFDQDTYFGLKLITIMYS
jgi:hypothetical protein